MKCFVKKNKNVLSFVVVLTVFSCIVVYASHSNIFDSDLAIIRGGCDCGEIYTTTFCCDKTCGPYNDGRIEIIEHTDNRTSVQKELFQVDDLPCYINTLFMQGDCFGDDQVYMGISILCRF